MDNGGGEAARSGELGIIVPGAAAVQGSSEANISTAGTFHGQLVAAAARRFSFVPGGVGAVYNGGYALQLRPGAAGHGEVPVNLLLPDHHAGEHGEAAFVGHLPAGGGGVAAYDDDYGAYLALQLCPGAGRGEVFLGPLPDGAVVGAVLDDSSDFVQQTVPGTGRAADGIAGNDDGEAYSNLGMVAEHLHRLLPFVGIGACSVAVNGLAASPGSPAVAFDLFAMFLGGMILVILHVLRV